MELATIPQNSSALSTEGSTQNNPSSSSGVGESRSGHKKTNKKVNFYKISNKNL
jgi:hypothetical protein